MDQDSLKRTTINYTFEGSIITILFNTIIMPNFIKIGALSQFRALLQGIIISKHRKLIHARVSTKTEVETIA